MGRGKTYALDRRGEEDVQEEERRCADPTLDQIPSVVLATNLVTTTAPVVESQAHRPYNAECHYVVHSLRLEPVHPSPHSIVNVVQGREDRPHAIHLAPVPVDFRDDQKDREEREREGEARYDRICRGVDILQSLEVANVGEDLLGQRVELRDPRFDGCAVRSTVGECLDQGHSYPNWWSDEHAGGVGQQLWCVRVKNWKLNSCSIC